MYVVVEFIAYTQLQISMALLQCSIWIIQNIVACLLHYSRYFKLQMSAYLYSSLY